ncbi:hypothetical protein [Acidovorax sp. sic0104]|uniref:hypothetical protein n=1 Tax=Acidovorax sp. sic0104 TaxID=2854784 RepID=UPI001C48C7EF|nr:hypothetical protein [Acidovorax sp. sic0104]MBV7542049.1 hypothetical protein [Acidovorax sp. sic0104]
MNAPNMSEPVNLPFPLLAARFLATLCGSRSGFLFYFGHAIPGGQRIDPRQVLQLRKNFIMCHLLVITSGLMATLLGTQLWMNVVGLCVQFVGFYWMKRFFANGVSPASLQKHPTVGELRDGFDRLEAEFPRIAPFLRANKMRTAFTAFEFDLVAIWAEHERRLRDAGVRL